MAGISWGAALDNDYDDSLQFLAILGLGGRQMGYKSVGARITDEEAAEWTMFRQIENLTHRTNDNAAEIFRRVMAAVIARSKAQHPKLWGLHNVESPDTSTEHRAISGHAHGA